MSEIFENNLNDVAGGAYNGYIRYTVKRGDTLSQLALDFGTTVKKLQEINNIVNPDIIKVGQVLLIPGKPAKDPYLL